MSQTVVEEQGKALVGQKYAQLKAENVLTLAAEIGKGRIPFGRFVSLGADLDCQGKLPELATDVTDLKAKRGVALQSHHRENLKDGLAPGYNESDPVSVMSRGGVYVEVEQAVDPSDDVFVRFADTAGGAGGTNEKGIFRLDDDTATAAQLVNARWLKSSKLVDGKLVAVLELL